MSQRKKKTHVVHLIGSSGLYGAERWILALMRAMDDRHFRSTLVNLVDREGEQSAVVLAATERGLDAFDFVTGGKFNPFAAVRLARWARNEGVEIFHGHGYKSDLLGMLAAKLAGCRIMTTPHGWSVEKDTKLQLYEKFDRFLFRFMDMVCPLSETLSCDVQKYCTGNIRLITNGVDLDEVRSSVANTCFDDDSYVIGYVGRLVESKDLVTLLNSVAALSEAGRRVKLVLVGDGDFSCQLKTYAKKMAIDHLVFFAGFRADAACFLRGFDCFVLPSLSEGTPRCVMEAMALNIPVVASDIPGNRILVFHNETGLLFPVGDSRLLSERIAFLMDHSGLAREMAERGNKKVEKEYSNRRMARDYAVVYEGLVASRQ